MPKLIHTMADVNAYLNDFSIEALTDADIPVFYYDFDDELGHVKAHRHPNGGGIVADTAHVDTDVYVDVSCTVGAGCFIKGNVVIDDFCSINKGSVMNGLQKGLIIERSLVTNSQISGAFVVNKNVIIDKTIENTGKKQTKNRVYNSLFR
jgi:NDP-sugar pyrophosphorylase family protein